jgi:TonB family protein
MRKLLLFALCALAAHATSGAAPKRVAPTQKPYHPAPYPAEARQKGAEGNVVLTGEIDAAGNVRSLRVLASSSPLFDTTALKNVQQWSFHSALENGKPLPIALNAVVRFRKDPGRPGLPRDPGAMPSAMVGNLFVSPCDAAGRSTGPEGFPVEASDNGVVAVLDLDLPKTSEPKAFHVVVADAGAGALRRIAFDKVMTGGGSTQKSVLATKFFRKFDARSPEEQGLHTLTVEVDGQPAGGACYRVAAETSAPPVSQKRRS